MYIERRDGSLRLRWLRAPTSAELGGLMLTLARRIGRFLERQGTAGAGRGERLSGGSEGDVQICQRRLCGLRQLVLGVALRECNPLVREQSVERRSLNQPEIATIGVVTTKPHQPDTAPQGHRKTVGRSIRLHDLIGSRSSVPRTPTRKTGSPPGFPSSSRLGTAMASPVHSHGQAGFIWLPMPEASGSDSTASSARCYARRCFLAARTRPVMRSAMVSRNWAR